MFTHGTRGSRRTLKTCVQQRKRYTCRRARGRWSEIEALGWHRPATSELWPLCAWVGCKHGQDLTSESKCVGRLAAQIPILPPHHLGASSRRTGRRWRIEGTMSCSVSDATGSASMRRRPPGMTDSACYRFPQTLRVCLANSAQQWLCRPYLHHALPDQSRFAAAWLTISTS